MISDYPALLQNSSWLSSFPFQRKLHSLSCHGPCRLLYCSLLAWWRQKMLTDSQHIDQLGMNFCSRFAGPGHARSPWLSCTGSELLQRLFYPFPMMILPTIDSKIFHFLIVWADHYSCTWLPSSWVTGASTRSLTLFFSSHIRCRDRSNMEKHIVRRQSREMVSREFGSMTVPL